MSAAWEYALERSDGAAGERRSASVRSLAPLYIAGHLGNPWLEIVEDATWGPQVSVRLHAGEVDPRSGRRVEVAIDDAAPFEVAATRPDGTPGTMSLRDARRVLDAIAAGRIVHLKVPVRRQGRPRMTFGVDGLDRAQLAVQRPRREA